MTLPPPAAPAGCRRLLNRPKPAPSCPAAPSLSRLLYWSAADGAARREAYDALAAAILCLGSSASSRWTAAAAVLRQAQQRGADDLPSVRAAGGGEQQSLHRVTLSDEPGQLLLLSRWAWQPGSRARWRCGLQHVTCPSTCPRARATPSKEAGAAAASAVPPRLPLFQQPDAPACHRSLARRSAGQVLQAGPDMQALLDRATQLKQRGAVQLEGTQYAVGDFRICLARAVQVWRAETGSGRSASNDHALPGRPIQRRHGACRGQRHRFGASV